MTWINERDFQKSIIDLAEKFGWSVYHVTNVRGNLRAHTSPGFPDLVLCKPPRVVFAEIKTEKGKLTPAQEHWQKKLLGSGMDARVWRPRHWPEIDKLLTTNWMRHPGLRRIQ